MTTHEEFERLMAQLDENVAHMLNDEDGIMDNPVAFITAEVLMEANRPKWEAHAQTCEFCCVYIGRLDAFLHQQVVFFEGMYQSLVERGRVWVEQFDAEAKEDDFTPNEAFAMGLAAALQITSDLRDLAKASFYIEKFREK